MKHIAVIGAGQLGSRHLQGLVKYAEEIKVYVLDPAIDSLKIAQERENQIPHTHEVVYSQTYDVLPAVLDLAIIATNAVIRESVIMQLVAKCTVKFLILEKVLFQELEAYKRVSELLAEKKVIAYVNHPRRMFTSYTQLKAEFLNDKKTVFQVVGGNWGLGCNALHFLDFFVYLSGKKIQSLAIDALDDSLIESSRSGFVEFTGTISGKLTDESFFSITSFKGEPSPITVTIFNDEQRYLIQEGGSPKSYKLLANHSFTSMQDDFNIQYQSELTALLAAAIFENGFCSLPTYEEARHTHELFIKVMLEKYNTITKSESILLPIT